MTCCHFHGNVYAVPSPRNARSKLKNTKTTITFFVFITLNALNMYYNDFNFPCIGVSAAGGGEHKPRLEDFVVEK